MDKVRVRIKVGVMLIVSARVGIVFKVTVRVRIRVGVMLGLESRLGLC